MMESDSLRNVDVQAGTDNWREMRVTSPEILESLLWERQRQRSSSVSENSSQGARLRIGELTIPSYLEYLGFFYVGSPGSGKSQTIFSNIETLLQREDFRIVVIDRGGEILEKFYDPERFVIFNPRDARSVMWSHRTEGVDFEMIANSLIPPDNHSDKFWGAAAIELLSSIYAVAQTNSEVYHLLRQPPDELADRIPNHEWMRDSEKTATCVVATAKTYSSFYRYLADEGEPFSFFNWASGNDPRSLIIPLFSHEIDSYRPLVTMAIRQVMKGLIANEEGRRIKTAIVIDELGALYRIDELMDLLAQGRKFQTCFIGATQTLSQLEKVYGQTGVDILLQTVRTKLILNCPDYRSATVLAQAIGVQEVAEVVRTVGMNGGVSYTQQVRERYVIHPSQIQQLQPLSGYVHISEGLPVARVTIRPVTYAVKAPRQVPRPAPVMRPSRKLRVRSSEKTGLPSLSGDEFLLCYVIAHLNCLLMQVNQVNQLLRKDLLVIQGDEHRVSKLLEEFYESYCGIQERVWRQLLRMDTLERKGLLKGILDEIWKGLK